MLTNELGEVEEDIPITGYIDSDGVVNVDEPEHPWSLAHTQGNMFTDLAIRARGLTTQVGFGGLSGTSPLQKIMGGAKRAEEYSRRHKKQAAWGGGKAFVQQRVRGGLLSTSSSARL